MRWLMKKIDWRFMMPLKDPEKRRAYHREYMRKRYAEDEDFRKQHRARTFKNDQRYKKQNIDLINKFRSNGCSLCDESEPCCLSAHHLDPDKKEFSLGIAVRTKKSPNRVRRELAKCICLCENCHRKVHRGVLKLIP